MESARSGWAVQHGIDTYTAWERRTGAANHQPRIGSRAHANHNGLLGTIKTRP